MGAFTELQRALHPVGHGLGHWLTVLADLSRRPDREAITVTPERRRRPRPATITGYLEQLPAVVLLRRLPIPMLAVADDGIIVFVNPACQVMLGNPGATITGQPLNHFLQVNATTAPDGVATLRDAAGEVTTWLGADDEIIEVVVSQPLLVRAEDPILFVGLTDVTEWVWTTGSSPQDGMAIHPPLLHAFSTGARYAVGRQGHSR